MTRTDLVIPAEVVPGLRPPPFAITNGAPNPVWVDVPLGLRFQRQPSLAVPLDLRTARSARRYVRLAPWSLVISLLSLAALSWYFSMALDRAVHLSTRTFLVGHVAPVAVGLMWPLVQGRLPAQAPRRDRSGGLRIPDVPLAVAHEWVRQNPGVVATDEPAPRPHSRRFYAASAVGLMLSSIGLGAILENDGREDFLLLWTLIPIFFIAGIVAAYKTQPPRRREV